MSHMFHPNFVDDDDMDLAGFDRARNDQIQNPFLYDEQVDYGSSSAAIPIVNPRSINQTNISSSNDGCDAGTLSSLSCPNSVSGNYFMPGHSVNGQYLDPGEMPRSTYGANQRYGFVGSLPQDPYPSPVVRNGVINLPAAMRATGLHPQQHDNLSTVYGQSCPESSFQSHHLQQIPGLKQMKFPVDISTNPMNMIFPHYSSQASAEIEVEEIEVSTSSKKSTVGAMFQFRAINPASAEQVKEKQKKRKESHNAVERRRRDHINEMIHQLGLLVDEGDGESVRLNKGEILQRTVEKIRFLEQVVQVQRDHIARIDPDYELPQIEIQPVVPRE